MSGEPRLVVKQVAYGRPASRALGEWLSGVKSADPLAPATVVVPSNFAGLSMRRLLASGALDEPDGHPGSPAGIANTSFDTLYGVAARLGSPVMASRGLRPLTNPVLAATIRRVLGDEPGYFAAVAGHPSTELALLGVYAELSRCLPETLDRLARSPHRRTREVIRLVNAVNAQLHDRYDEDELASEAARAVADGSAPVAELGSLSVFLPQDLSPAMVGLVRALAGAAPVEMLLGVTGAPDADRQVLELADSLGCTAPTPDVDRPEATAVVSTADTDEEVRAVVRQVMVRAERGSALNRIGVLYPRGDPYARLVSEHFESAGIPFNGPATRRLSDSVAGHLLLAFLGLPDSDFARDDIIDLVSVAPVRDEAGCAVPASAWDTISRRAGVLGGRADWSGKLQSHRDDLADRLGKAEAEQRSDGLLHHYRSRIELTQTLGRFVENLCRLLDATVVPSTWQDMSSWARDAMSQLLGPPTKLSGWEEAQLEAYEAVERALERLSVLDGIEPGPSLDTFRHAVLAELDAPMPRRGRFGEGVVCGPVSMASGLDLDVVFILGMAEGSCPAPRRESSLLPDSDRGLSVAGELPLRAAQLDLEHRRYLAALSCGFRERVLVHPRGDERNGRQRLVSRWLLDSVSALSGRRIYSSEFADLRLPAVTVVESYVAGVRGAPTPASEADHDLGSLLRGTESGRDLRQHHLVREAALSSAVASIDARNSPAFTSFDGNLAGAGVSGPIDGEPISPTRLERWASCPFRYFLGDVLGLGDLAKPERIFEISPLEKGGLVHEVLERFLGPLTEKPAAQRPRPQQSWSEQERQRLVETALASFSDREQQGLTGRSLVWRLHKAGLLTDLVSFLESDDHFRRELGAVPEAVELPFGIDGEPVSVTLPDGRQLSFRGYADRVDLTADGSPVVLDYKTGKPDAYEEIIDDTVAGGTVLQLPVYAEAARQLFGSDSAHAFYWFVSRRGDFRRIGYEFDEPRRDRFLEVVETIADGIGSGVFPLSPGPWSWFHDTNDNCAYCDFDRLCPRARFEQSEAKIEAPELWPFLSLIDEEPEAADES